MNKFKLLSSSGSLDGLKQSISKWFCNEKFELKNRSYNDTIVIYKNDTCLEHYRIIFKNSRYRFEMESIWLLNLITLYQFAISYLSKLKGKFFHLCHLRKLWILKIILISMSSQLKTTTIKKGRLNNDNFSKLWT